MAKRTPLYDIHIKYGGKIVEFAGHDLPVQYESGLIAEHTAVRTAAGIFDVSHMGELIVSGGGAENALNYLLTNNISGMYDGQVRYSVLPNERGGAIDDVLVYRMNAEKFLLVVNASNLAKDAAWIESQLPKNVMFENISDNIAQIALQGPKSLEILNKIMKDEHIPKKYYSFIDGAVIAGRKCLVSQTGYTGESGYEIYCDNKDAAIIYEAIMEAGKPLGLMPAGLGARDTLRLEAGMPLYGHELGEDIPLGEVGLGFAIKLNKEDFVGKKAIENHVPLFSRLGARVVDRGIAREHSIVYSNGVEVGVVTSGTHSPTLGYAIVVLRLKNGYENAPLEADVRGRRLKLEIIPLPFYKKA